ncbi:MAG: HTTM domain-containing protein [Polyangiaceae bacterium]
MTNGFTHRVVERYRRIEPWLVTPVDIAWLAAFRALFGLTLCVSMWRFIGYGWVDVLFVKPRFHFKYWGLSWVEPLSGPAMHTLFWVMSGLALCVAAGVLYRFTSALLTAGLFYIQAVDVSNYLNHYYLALLLSLLLTLSPAAHAASFDARCGLCRRDANVSRAWLALFRFQVGVVYVFAGLAKAHADWLFHAQPLGIWLGARDDLPWLGRLLALPHAALFMSWAGFLFDSCVVAFLSIARTRAYAYAVVIVFHLLTRALFPIGMFPVIMVLSALVFFPPAWPRRWLAWFPGRALSPSPEARRSGWVRAGYALGAGYCALQLLLPLRFLAYGGNVRWHEQGMRFSWRVMVREKNGAVTFMVRNKASGHIFHVSPRRYLTGLQEREMSSQPDLIAQLARHIKADFAARGLGDVEVRADAWVSLNGRAMTRMVDPSVDLSTVPDGLGKARWILPAPTTAPPQLRVLGRQKLALAPS